MSQSFGDCVTLTRDGPIATVILDRQDGRNALSLKAMQALIDAASYLAADTDIHVVILAGEGAFTAGADLKDPDRAAMRDRTRLEQRQSLKLGPDMCAAWENLEQITIAAVEKYCIGGGVALAVACDHRIAGEDAHFRLPEIPLGMNMSWQTNPRTAALIGPSRAKQFTILGEPVPAQKALDWGLVDDVTAPGGTLQAARALAERYASVPPIALRMTKQAINVATNPLGLATSYMDRDQFAYASTTNDQSEAIAAFLEKRDPAFKGN
jgi:enoyl-CoA hydratase